MTKQERRNPDIIKGRRKERIAKGSGTQIQEVTGLDVDGIAATPELLASAGPEELFREAVAAIKAECGLSEVAALHLRLGRQPKVPEQRDSLAPERSAREATGRHGMTSRMTQSRFVQDEQLTVGSACTSAGRLGGGQLRPRAAIARPAAASVLRGSNCRCSGPPSPSR